MNQINIIKSLLLLIFASTVFVISSYPDNNLHVISCDVGQGDGTLLVYKNFQIVIDGGMPNSGLMSCISDYVPFWDRTIELVVLTHPQFDHFGGLIEVLDAYTVNDIMISRLKNSTLEYQLLEKAIGSSGAQIVEPHNVGTIGYGLLQLDILWPDKSYVNTHSELLGGEFGVNVLGTRKSMGDPNDFSIVLMVRLGDFECLLTGDIGPAISDEVTRIMEDKKYKNLECIKVPHHGSKNGLSQNLLDFGNYKIATISSGKNNRFGHPHREILDMLSEAGIEVYRTDQLGDIEIVSDGVRYWIGN